MKALDSEVTDYSNPQAYKHVENGQKVEAGLDIHDEQSLFEGSDTGEMGPFWYTSGDVLPRKGYRDKYEAS
jgi:hypothetical protein